MSASSAAGCEEFNQQTPWGGCISALDTDICSVSLRYRNYRRTVLQHALRCRDTGTGHSEVLAPRFCFRGSDAVSIWRPIGTDGRTAEIGWRGLVLCWRHKGLRTQIVVKCQRSDTAHLLQCASRPNTPKHERESRRIMCAWGNAGEVCWASQVCLLRWCALMVPWRPWEAKSEGDVFFNCSSLPPTNPKSASLPRDVHQEKGYIYQGQERRALLSCPKSEEGNSLGVWEALRSWLLSNWRKLTNREVRGLHPSVSSFCYCFPLERHLKKNLSFLFCALPVKKLKVTSYPCLSNGR